MSADNWRICPKCLENVSTGRSVAIEKAKASYGTVPLEDFQKAMDKAKALPQEPDDTLREDYELGVDEDGVFFVNYSCSCHYCGFSFKFKTTQKALQ